jgi:hypothetical protein
MVELDRAGCNEYVQYNQNTAEVHAFLAKFSISNGGYGSYSDIATISGHTHIPSVNLAIGYTRQHSDMESLDLSAMEMMIAKTRLIIHRYVNDKPQLGKTTERTYATTHVSSKTNGNGGIYSWTPSAKGPGERRTTAIFPSDEDTDVVKCADCGQTNGDHNRSCPEYRSGGQEELFAA